jgi:hypothetical protein
MKVTITYQCDLEDIPKTISELLENIDEHDLEALKTEIMQAKIYGTKKNITETLASIDAARLLLSKIDLKLMDYSGILAEYVKTDADLKLGKGSPFLPELEDPLGGTQEVSPTDIISSAET